MKHADDRLSRALTAVQKFHEQQAFTVDEMHAYGAPIEDFVEDGTFRRAEDAFRERLLREFGYTPVELEAEALRRVGCRVRIVDNEYSGAPDVQVEGRYPYWLFELQLPREQADADFNRAMAGTP